MRHLLSYLFVTLLMLSWEPMSAQRRKKSEPSPPEPMAQIDEDLYDGLTWRSIGPFRGGRSAAVTGVPGQPNLYYFGATGGGVWRTQDGGQTWVNISDGYFGGSIGAVAVSEWDPNVIYVGGGEVTVRGNVSYGYGMWKSVDAGKTWTPTGLENSRHIPRLRIHPRNPDLVYAAVMGDLFKSSEERGVYRSKDGGKTWEKILYANADAGAVDLIMDPTNPRILYASTWRIRRTPYSLESGGEGSDLYKSTDGGDTWTKLTGQDNGLPNGTLGIIGVTVSPANPERVWAIVEADKGGVYRSEDGGENWQRINESRALRQRAWYYSRIYADSKDQDVVYVMNVNYHKSTDGGRTFKAYNAPHGDHHDLWIAPEDPQRMIIADDGGAQVSFDGGENWSTYYNQPTAQFYRVTTDQSFPYRIYAAQQDNSTIRISHRTSGFSIGERDWEPTAGGESAHIAPDPKDNEVVYGGSYGGFLTRVDHRNDNTRAINVWPDNPMGYGAEGMKYRFQWNFPILFSPHDDNRLYAASNHLHVSTDGGASWEIISPDLTRNDSAKLVSSGGPITKDNTGVEYYCTIFAVAESPTVEGLIWAGSDDGLIHLTRDGGENWENVTPPSSLMPEWTMINSIDVDPFHEGGVYVAATSYKSGDYHPYLYKTEDYGETWKKIVQGIPEDHFTRVLRADPKREGLLYAGTETGMYVSFDDGSNWLPFQLNLPLVPITDLAVKNDNLIAATQGRSLWMIDDLTPLHQLKAELKDQVAYLFQPMPSYRMEGRGGFESRTAGTNHPGGVMIHYYLKEEPAKETEIRFTFFEEDGDSIRSFSSTNPKFERYFADLESGINRFRWDMEYEPATVFPGMILWWGKTDGPIALPGSYRVRMHVGEDSMEQSFEIVKDPRVNASEAELKAQFDLLTSIRDKVSETHQAITDIRDTRKQLNGFTKRAKEDESMTALVDEAKRIDSVMTEIEKSLYQTKNRSGQDPLNFPIQLNNKLAHLGSLVAVGQYAPTQQATDFYKEVTKRIDEQLEKWYQLTREDIPAFNQGVKSRQIDVITVKPKDAMR